MGGGRTVIHENFQMVIIGCVKGTLHKKRNQDDGADEEVLLSSKKATP